MMKYQDVIESNGSSRINIIFSCKILLLNFNYFQNDYVHLNSLRERGGNKFRKKLHHVSSYPWHLTMFWMLLPGRW